QRAASGRVPDPHLPVRAVLLARFAARGEGLAVGGPGDAVDVLGVALEGEQLLPRGDAPNLDDVVLAGRGEALPVGAERHLPDAVAVTAQGAHLTPGPNITAQVFHHHRSN